MAGFRNKLLVDKNVLGYKCQECGANFLYETHSNKTEALRNASNHYKEVHEGDPVLSVIREM